MKDVLKNLALALWMNHRKKLIAFVLGLLFAGVAALTGIPLAEIQEAAKEAANKPAPVEAPLVPASAIPAPAVVPAPEAPKAPAK